MKTYKFKTNINCGGCISTVSPYLDQLSEAEWKVDTNDKRKVLEVKSDNVSEGDIISKVQEAGYEIEPLKSGFLGKLFK